MSHNNTNMSQRAQDPKTKNEKTERREGEEGKKKKSARQFRFKIGASEIERVRVRETYWRQERGRALVVGL